VHGHYAEAGEIAALVGSVLNSPVCFTGSLLVLWSLLYSSVLLCTNL
jgi:hypothetical protein